MEYIIVGTICALIGAGTMAAILWSFILKTRARAAEANAVIADRDKVWARDAELTREKNELELRRKEAESRFVTAEELLNENRILKRDLFNLSVERRKLAMDGQKRDERQDVIELRSKELAEEYLATIEKIVGQSVNANNYASLKQRLQKAISWCREIGFEVTEEREQQLLDDLKRDFEMAVRAAVEREEQTRIKAQIREEQQREREIQREMQALEREREAIRAALERAMKDAKDAHSEEVERLKARLAEAEERNQRAIAQAQLTRAGHIYVISNLGAFGENVYKIGMTRRLTPQDRIDELGDASVPFPFDVHMMISCNDAPALENALHRKFHGFRMNKVNPRKEFFRVDLAEVHRFVVEQRGEVHFVSDAEALQYRQSISMSPEDERVIEEAFNRAERAIGAPETEE